MNIQSWSLWNMKTENKQNIKRAYKIKSRVIKFIDHLGFEY